VDHDGSLPGAPPRSWAYSLEWLRKSPGARKEEIKRRSYSRRRSGGGSPGSPGYAELHLASAFSFLDGASLPEDLVQRAVELELPAVALVDRNGVYGAPRFYKAAREAGIKALVGAEVTLEDSVTSTDSASKTDVCHRELPHLALLVAERTGYRNLCKLSTAAARDRPKGEARADWEMVESNARGLWCLAGGAGDPIDQQLAAGDFEAADQTLGRLRGLFDGRLHVELQRHRLREEEHHNQALIELARRHRLPLVATNGVRYARRADKRLHDVLSCIRHKTHLDAAGRLLAAHRERHLKSAAEMGELFRDQPRAVAESLALAERLDFTLADLGYRFPDYPLPPDETPSSYLRQITWNEARARFRPLTARAQAQIAKELAMIDKLDLAGYFLIVWDLIQFCKRERIMAQGRGSAANSAVCYALSITAVDPVKMGLLFERFLSEERGEWPDVDLDLPSGDQREKVIQYVYSRYGPHGAAMTANVITYRDRSSAREVAKALGYSREQEDRLSKRLGTWHYDTSRGDPKRLSEELAEAGLDPEDPRVELYGEMWQRMHNLPRHLGQHSGGMVIAAGRLDEVVPLEPAAMQDRVVVQWDKDDCADLGIIKVDLLGLGMLQALEEAIPIIRTHEKTEVDLAHLPADDPPTYEMLREADTVGVFQVESRAQMASLPRNQPEKFYDLVIQVAIIRPGPIVGGLVHPFFERRRGREEVVYPHPCLEPILERTLGVPIFQEQILRMAMEAAGFTGGEAEELRRAMGFKRSMERMESIEQRLRSGMAERGITGEAQEMIVQSITSFALYGFPESHAASFALIAYASAYLKRHHPAAFYVSLLNAWPMGFYHPATLVKDAQRHGVEARPIDVNRSGWKCSWEDNRRYGERHSVQSPFPKETRPELSRHAPSDVRGAIRLGLRYVHGLRKEAGETIELERPFTDIEDLTRRCRLRAAEVHVLAANGALASLGMTRREALWQAAEAVRPAGPLLEGHPSQPQKSPPKEGLKGEGSPLSPMTPFEETMADYSTSGITTGPHPLAHMRPRLERYGITRTAELERRRHGDRVRIAGSVIVRQRPGTAKGVLFVTVEDETGMAQAIVRPELLQENRRTIVGSPGLVVEGTLQCKDGSMSIQGERFWALSDLARTPSHDFR
jgi:error-prone DNA polymerase